MSYTDTAVGYLKGAWASKQKMLVVSLGTVYGIIVCGLLGWPLWPAFAVSAVCTLRTLSLSLRPE